MNNIDNEDLDFSTDAEDLELELDSDLFEHFRFVVDPGQQALRIDKYLGMKFAKIAGA